MEASQRDTTDDWRITPARAPATVVELEGRIDLALSTARLAEEAALEIGAASLEAAEQARRAAALAERASVAAARAAADVAAAGANPPRVMAVEPAASAVAERPSAPEQAPPPDPAPVVAVVPHPVPEPVDAALPPISATVATAPSTEAAIAERDHTAPPGEAPTAGPETTEFAPSRPSERANGALPRQPDPFDERLTAFRERAEKVMVRLQKLEAGDPPGAPSEVVRLR
jgi:hypothetical protein